MLANANTQATTTRQVREVMAICTQNDVPIGKPDNLADFLRALDHNKHLAMNFWAMVSRCEKDHHTEDPDWLLNSIVEGVTGRSVAELDETGPSARLMVVKLSSVLAGEDVPVAQWPDEPPTRELDDPAEAGRWARQSAPGRITPIAPRVQTAEPARPQPSDPRPAERITNPAWLNDGSLRLVLHPEPATDEPPIAIPLSAYASENPQRTISVFWFSALLLTVLAISGVWYVIHRNPAALTNLAVSMRASVASATAALHRTASPSPAPAVAPSNSLNASSAPTQPVATPPPASATPLDAATPAPAAGTTSSPQPPTVAAARPAPNPSPEHARRELRDTDTSPANDAVPTNPRAVVPETLMHQNLISSRVPIRPDGVRASQFKGLVVLHAVITSNGRVEDLRAISGDPALRSAAMDAASTWRYRPYLLNGTPVDVSTTISVDFSE